MIMNKNNFFTGILIMAMLPLCFTSCFPDDDIPSKSITEDTKLVGEDVQIMMTTGDKTLLGQMMTPIAFDEYIRLDATNTITLDLNTEYQEVDGFGAAMTGSSAYLLRSMDAVARAAALKELFDPKEGLGISILRLPIGHCDYSLERYTYCDNPPISNFAVPAIDKRDLLPVLKEILAINPDIKFFATTWSAPQWMRKQNVWTGGGNAAGIKDESIDDFATYYLKYVQAMAAEGINIYAVCPQNEPLSSGNAVSMCMTPAQQIAFIKSLAPKFTAANIKTKIICFDHNWDISSYVDDVYADPDVFQMIDGAAFHAYGGDISTQTAIHNKYPSKNIYFTEQSGGSWSSSFPHNLSWYANSLFIGGLTRWTKCVILWNIMLDKNHGPYLLPGAATNLYGILDLASDGTYLRYAEYYALKQLRDVRPGAKIVRTYGYSAPNLIYTAAVNTDGTKVFLVFNASGAPQSFIVNDGTNVFSYTINNYTQVSFTWK
jgi:glucosylceramidase